MGQDKRCERNERKKKWDKIYGNVVTIQNPCFVSPSREKALKNRTHVIIHILFEHIFISKTLLSSPFQSTIFS